MELSLLLYILCLQDGRILLKSWFILLISKEIHHFARYNLLEKIQENLYVKK